ncbi:MAG: TolC family protein, partial [Bryobacterales bacterium]|nr:TolC family protein [Bryobacterales bacterium]
MQKALVLFFSLLPLFVQAQPAAAERPGSRAGERLSLREAVTRALSGNPGIEAMRAREKAAASQVDAARSGYLPRVNYQEMVQRGNNPVYVFGALLTQRQFAERNFAIGSLNRPNFLNNFQSTVTVDQVLYNAGRTRNAIKGAETGRQMGELETRSAELQVMQRVLEAYFGAKL